MTSNNQRWAERYVAAGMVVLPLWPGRKRPHASRRHPSLLGPSFSLRDAGASEPGLVDRWWSAWPEAGIGIVCGRRSRLLVIDVDHRPDVDGERSLIDWEQERYDAGLRLPEAPLVRTPSGGLHLWYRLPPGIDLKGRDAFLPGVDVCGSIHWVAAPPTLIREHGRRYELVRWPPGGIPEVPPWLVTELRTGSGRRAGGTGVPYDVTGRSYAADLDELPDLEWFVVNGLRRGSRDRDCYRLACRLWRQPGATDAIIEQQLWPIWQRRALGEPDFTWEDAVGKIHYAREFVRRQERDAASYATAWMTGTEVTA